MGLFKWDLINDYFSHEQLAANWQAVDEHNHTLGKGVQIPYGGLAEQSVGVENMRASAKEALVPANLSITEGKLADGAVTSRKWKPGRGIKHGSENQALTEAFIDVAGLKLEITPAVASFIQITLVMCVQSGTNAASEFQLLVDGVAQEALVRMVANPNTSNSQQAAQCYDISLTPALHTIKVQGKKLSAPETKTFGIQSSMLYQLMSA